MPATKEDLQEIVKRAVSGLQKNAPRDGFTDKKALDQFYKIFDSTPFWKPLANGSAEQGRSDDGSQPATIRQKTSFRRSS